VCFLYFWFLFFLVFLCTIVFVLYSSVSSQSSCKAAIFSVDHSNYSVLNFCGGRSYSIVEPHAPQSDMFSAALTLRGPHTNVRCGPFPHTRSQNFLCWGCSFLPQKLTPFLSSLCFSHETCGFWTYVQTSKQRGKNLAFILIGGPLATGGASHGTTGTMVNPALDMLCLQHCD